MHSKWLWAAVGAVGMYVAVKYLKVIKFQA